MPSSLIVTLLISIISFLITYGIGQLLSAFIKIPDRFPFLKEFAKLTIGFYIVSTFYAILNTNGITIQLGLLPIGVLTVYWLKENKYLVSWSAYKKNLATSFKLQYLSIQLSVLVLSILYLYFNLYGIQGNTVKTINGDFFCYASYIENINKMGVESSYLDWYSGIPPLRNFYHWGNYGMPQYL